MLTAIIHSAKQVAWGDQTSLVIRSIWWPHPDTISVALLDGVKSLSLVVFRTSCLDSKEKAYASLPQREGLSLASRVRGKIQRSFFAKRVVPYGIGARFRLKAAVGVAYATFVFCRGYDPESSLLQ